MNGRLVLGESLRHAALCLKGRCSEYLCMSEGEGLQASRARFCRVGFTPSQTWAGVDMPAVTWPKGQ